MLGCLYRNIFASEACQTNYNKMLGCLFCNILASEACQTKYNNMLGCLYRNILSSEACQTNYNNILGCLFCDILVLFWPLIQIGLKYRRTCYILKYPNYMFNPPKTYL